MRTPSSSIVLRSVSPSDLSDAEVQEIFHLRMSMKSLKPGSNVQVEEDKFGCRLKGLTRVVVAADHEGSIVGFCAGQAFELDPVPLIQIRYTYVLPATRAIVSGSYLTARVISDLVGGVPATHGFLAATASLPGFLMTASFGDAYIWTDDDVPPSARRAMEFVAADEPTMDLTTGIATSPASRVGSVVQRPADGRRADLFDRYLAVNPRWADGDQLLVCTKVRRSDLVS